MPIYTIIAMVIGGAIGLISAYACQHIGQSCPLMKNYYLLTAVGALVGFLITMNP